MTLSADLAWLLGELAAVAHVAIAATATVHILLYKRNISSSISWMGIAWLSPFIGGALYFALGVNRVKRHTKITTGARGAKQGGIETVEAPISASNVMVIDDQGTATRVGYRRDEESGRQCRQR